MNDMIFSKISNWLRNVVASTYDWIKDDINSTNTHEPVYQSIQQLSVLLDCLIGCTEQMSALSTQIYTEDADNIIPVMLNIVFTSFSHCQEQNVIYNDYVEVMKDPLDTLFEKSGLLWLNTNSLLLKLHVRQSADDKDFITAVLNVLMEIADIGFENVKVVTSLWKLYAKLAVENAGCLQEQLDVDSALKVLIKLLKNKLQVIKKLCRANEISDNSTETIILKLLRICGFIFKIVVLLCEKFNSNLSNSCEQLLHIILLLNTYSPPSREKFALNKNLQNEMAQQLTVGVEPLVGYLIDNVQFISLVVTTDHDTGFVDVTPFAWCLLFVSVLQKLPTLEKDSYNNWMALNPLTILHRIYNILPYCHSELMLPIYLSALTSRGSLPSDISFYEYLCVRICAFAACITVGHFSILENVLLENLLSTHFWCRQLAADVWAFLGRYSLPDVCYHHCITLAEIVTKCKQINVLCGLHLVSLVNRLISFLAEDHLEKFLSTLVGMKFLELYIQKRSATCLMPAFNAISLKAQSNFRLLTKPQSVLKTYELMSCLKILSTAMKLSEVEPVQLNESNQIILSIWNTNIFDSLTLERVDWDLMEKIILITSLSIKSFKDNHILQILRILCTITSQADEISRFHIVKCLSVLSRRRFGAHPQQSSIFNLISDLFAAVLRDQCWIVRDAALEAFSTFSHETKHESIIIQIINGINDQHVITNYLNKVPYQTADATDLVTLLKTEQTRLLTEGSSEAKCEIVNSKRITETEDQERVRRRLKESLSELEKTISDLTDTFPPTFVFPDWAKERLKIIEQKIHSLPGLHH